MGLKLGKVLYTLWNMGLELGKVLYTLWNMGLELGMFFSKCNFVFVIIRLLIWYGNLVQV